MIGSSFSTPKRVSLVWIMFSRCALNKSFIYFECESGPYTFGLGLVTYLCSKEIYIMEHEFYTGLSIAIMGIYAVKKLGPATAKWLDSEVAVWLKNLFIYLPQLNC